MRARLLAGLVLLAMQLLSGSAMAYPTFTCAYEQGHNPPLDAEAERWFQQARHLERAMGPWPEVERLYQKAMAKDHFGQVSITCCQHHGLSQSPRGSGLGRSSLSDPTRGPVPTGAGQLARANADVAIYFPWNRPPESVLQNPSRLSDCLASA